MSASELGVIGIGLAVFATSISLLRQDPRRSGHVFLLACITGFIAQLPLGRDLNRYTPNITLYVFYVSVSVVVMWGISLMAIYSAHHGIARLLGIRPNALLYFLCSLPIIVIIEFIGTNVVQVKLHDHARYAPLMPVFNSMQAPIWLYGYYVIVQFLFYQLLRWRGIDGERLIRAPRPSSVTAKTVDLPLGRPGILNEP